ncbi:c-type cytochrome biogenesis protein CcsB [Flexivirga endophytica]|uniref:C-type cytochrome biogenesis protein CcsB n=1 Tax=Flexivirga endophytica TaxID=1849103 RepID=A0A916TH02_9MICO|nr:c-type cytochrome biogenesis protein CcsB [Flexivirga endophytica]GGB42746.1 c-type cytochrome biogenesis protein CcsB [Flexivirga endophytica]GHB64241.1 c-type cytochrome biogenesis protein CcsB [Flexivirga endophytica]
MITLTPSISFDWGGHATDVGLSNLSNNFLYASAVVLVLAMMSFAADLATYPGRMARAEQREAEAAEKSAAVSAGSSSGGTAVLERTAEGTGAIPEKRQWAGIGMSLSWLGFLLVAACVVLRSASVGRPPLGNMYEFAIVGAFFVMGAFLGWSLRRDVRSLGIFVVGPTVLTEMLAGLVFYTDASQLLPSLKNYWLSIHVTVAILSVAFFTIAFSTTILYFVQKWREDIKDTKYKFMDAVPGSEVMDRTTYGLLIIAFPLWTFTVIAGAIWAQKAWGNYWGWDPKEVWSLVIWVVYAAYLHARATAGWGGKKAAYIALAGFGCVLFNFCVVNIFIVGMHSYSGM